MKQLSCNSGRASISIGKGGVHLGDAALVRCEKINTKPISCLYILNETMRTSDKDTFRSLKTLFSDAAS